MRISSSRDVLKIPQAVWQDNLSRRCFITAFSFWFSGLFLLFLFLFKLPPQVPLFYSRPWGEEQLVLPGLVFLLPGSVLLILIINLLATTFWVEEKLLLRTLAVASAICAFLGLFALIEILKLTL